MKAKDKMTFELKGEFNIVATHKETGEVVYEHTDHNLIVNKAQEAVIHAISGIDDRGFILNMDVGQDFTNTTGSIPVTFYTGGGNRIVRTTGSWIDDGFDIAEDDIFIDYDNNGSNDYELTFTSTGGINDGATYTVSSVSADGLTMNIVEAPTSTGATTSTFTAGTAELPAPPSLTFDGTQIDKLLDLDAISQRTIDLTTTPSVTFSSVIDGGDINTGSGQGVYVSVQMTSAALYWSTNPDFASADHAADIELFAYKRFPQVSVSPLIDVAINWTIRF